MRLLILTQKVDANDDLLGFFHSWLFEFAKNVSNLTVLALGVGDYDLPENAKVFSLGKEAIGSKRFKKMRYALRFYKLIWQLRREYDAVFVHMNVEYVILGGLFWRLFGKKTGLWYVHRQTGVKLKIAEILANKIFSASKESFRLSSQKLFIIGHGIDLSQFQFRPEKTADREYKIVYVGRLSRIKNQKLLIEAAKNLKEKNVDFSVDLIGGPTRPADDEYYQELKKAVGESGLSGRINFIGSVPNKNIAPYYQKADLSVNLCPTGGVDKAVLESLASGTPVVAFNKAFETIFGRWADCLILKNLDARELAEKLLAFRNLPEAQKKMIKNDLRQEVEKNNSLEATVKKIIAVLFEKKPC